MSFDPHSLFAYLIVSDTSEVIPILDQESSYALRKEYSMSHSSLLPILDLEVPDLNVTAWKKVIQHTWKRSGEIDTQRLNFHEITDLYHDDWMKLHRFEYDHFYSAWTAIAFRLRACTDHDRVYTEVFDQTHGAADNIDLYQEDDALFGFFVKGFSALESFYYSLYALGALIFTPAQQPSVPPPSQFLLLHPTEQKKLRAITPTSTYKAFKTLFPGLPLTDLLGHILEDAVYKEWKDIRNLLAHRVATAGRSIEYRGLHPFQGRGIPVAVTQWASDLSLTTTTTAYRYDWLKETINRGLEETVTFTKQQLPYAEDQLPPLW